MADIQYLNYGDQQIEQQALLNNLANQVQGYVQKQPWSNKRKEMFMSAYSELMNRGIQGASNTNGQWMLNVGGDTPLDLDSKSKKEKEMYQEAAYFIQQQMAGLPTKTSQEEEKKKDLPVFDNKYFTSELIKHISNKDYGGQDILMGDGEKENDWNRLDARDEKGIRGRKNRAKVLAGYLKEYSDSLDESKLSFEGSPFANLNDFKGRINKAIEALGTENTEDDIPALNAIGLKASDWFNNGSGDPFKTEGYEGTYGDYYGRFLPQQEKDKAKVEAEKQKAQQANYWSGYKYYNLSKYNGRPLTSEESNLEHLNKIISKDKWSGDEASQIVQAFKLAERNGQLVSITDKNELAKFGPMWKNRVKQLRKINGIEGIYYDTVGKKFVKPYNGQTLQTSFQDILDQNSSEVLQQKQLTTPRQLSDGLEYEDYARIGAALGDVISLGGFGANVVGSIVSLFGDTTADIADNKVSTWEAVKNFGKNLGWTAAGFIPGAKLGKVAKNIMRWAPKMLVALNDYNLLNDESNKNTWNKLTNESKLLKEGLNDEDLKNITYWVRAFTGTANAIKATGRDIKYSKARGTTGQKFKTKDGTEVQLSDKAVAEINIAGAKKGQKAAEAKFKEKVKEATGQEHEVADGTFKFSENGRKYFSNTRSKVQDQRLQGESVVFRTPEQQRYYDLLQQDRSLGGLGGWRPLWQRGTSSYFDHFDKGSFKNPLNGILRKVDPYKNMINSQNQSGNNQTNPQHQNNSQQNQQNQHQNQKRTREIPDNFEATGKAPVSPKHNLTRNEWKKKNKKLYNSIDKKGRFTNNMPEEGTYEFKDPTGNTHTFKLIQRDDDFLLDIKSSNGSSKQAVLTLDQVKKGVWENIKQSLNTGLRNDISLPANIIRTLQGTAYGWLKQGGRIDKQKIQKYKEFINK